MALQETIPTQIDFKFGDHYVVSTSHPYRIWKVYWYGKEINSIEFDHDGYRPETKLTVARARECFEQSVDTRPLKTK